MRALILSLAAVAYLAANAQITLVTTTSRITGLRGLPDGNKYWSCTTSGLTIYNTDLTVYQSITYPPAPAGWTYSITAFYITASLFDTDPSTIEFLVQLQNGGNIGARVLRMDGTVLLEDLVHGMFNGAGPSPDLNASIMSTDDGTVLLLQQGLSTTAIYQLPGTLPCLECDGISTGLAPEPSVADPATPSAMAYPNPAAGAVRFACTVPPGLEHVALEIMDVTGRVVRTAPVRGSGALDVDLAGEAAGNYLYRLVYANGRTTAKQLLVIGTGR